MFVSLANRHIMYRAKALCLAVFAFLLCMSCCHAGEVFFSPRDGVWTLFDRHGAEYLPPKFQNHCALHNGRFYCAHHCGTTYEFFYCSRISYGCCHIGDGYCDYRGWQRLAEKLRTGRIRSGVHEGHVGSVIEILTCVSLRLKDYWPQMRVDKRR